MIRAARLGARIDAAPMTARAEAMVSARERISGWVEATSRASYVGRAQRPRTLRNRVMEQRASPSTEMPRTPGAGGLRRAVLRGLLVVGLFAVVVLVIQELVPGAGKRLAEADLGWLALAVAI